MIPGGALNQHVSPGINGTDHYSEFLGEHGFQHRLSPTVAFQRNQTLAKRAKCRSEDPRVVVA
jgi:hypothetical protein